MGCEGTLATWDLATVLGRKSQDIPGYSEAVHHIFVYLGQLGKSVAVLDIYEVYRIIVVYKQITFGQNLLAKSMDQIILSISCISHWYLTLNF